MSLTAATSDVDQLFVKGLFSARVGTTSYIVPDEILPNVRFLADKVDDIELVLFESDEMSNFPDHEQMAALVDLATEHDLTYTVHLPMDMYLGDADEQERQRSVAKCLRTVQHTRLLDPFGYVLHLHGDPGSHTPGVPGPPSSDIPRWQSSLRRSVSELLAAGLSPRELCVETLSYPFELVEGLVEEFDLAVCLDVGHLLLNGFDLTGCMRRHQARCRVVHAHGIRDGKDHADLAALPAEVLQQIRAEILMDSSCLRVVTMEVFSESDFRRSCDTLRELAP